MIMSRRARMSVFALLCLGLLAPPADSRPADDRARCGRPTLFRVSRWDERSGRQQFGFIDNAGKLVVGFNRLPGTTVSVGEFCEGRAMIVVPAERDAHAGGLDTKVGFIDESGRVVIEPRYASAHDFSEGLAFAWGGGFLGFIDRDGREVFNIDRIDVGDFHDGLATIRLSAAWPPEGGFIDRSGRVAIRGPYGFVDDFSEGLAGVEVTGGIVSRVGFIDTKGEMVIPPRFGVTKGGDALVTVATARFSEGLACVKGDGGYGYIDKRGEFVIPPRFKEAQGFSEGLAWVKTPQDKAGWIDRSGRWAVTLAVNDTHPAGFVIASTSALNDWAYSEGLVPFVIYSGKRVLRGYMDRTGRVAIEPKEFDTAGPFRGGLARVTFFEGAEYRKGRTGYFDQVTRQYMAEKYGYIDRAGRFVWREP